jgi:acetyl-CoA synthetase
MKDSLRIQKSLSLRSSANFNPTNSLTNVVDWKKRYDELLQRRGGFLNICYEAVDQHLVGPDQSKTALRFIGKGWPKNPTEVREYSYRELAEKTCQVAQGFRNLGIKKGDVVFGLAPRRPELYFVVLGSLRLGAVFSPLFSAFGPEPILARMKKGHAKAIFSLASYYRKKIEPIRSQLPDLEHVILIDDDGSLKDISGVVDFQEFFKETCQTTILEKTNPEDMALLHFTSGTTGQPKGAVHVHGAVVYHQLSGQIALDLKPQDLFWCTADPGWVTGISYGIIAPLTNGLTLIIDEGDFQAQRWYQILEKCKVTVWYTAPTAMRMLMKAGSEIPQQFDLSHVRLAASVGEPLNPEVIRWTHENLGLAMHDNWWQSETGGIIISNYLAMDIKPGSMGKPIPGLDVCLARKTSAGEIEFVNNPQEQGEIVIRRGWPSMFRGYLNEEERTKKCFSGDWYFSGDLATRDEEGYFWFVGRTDDVIKSSGHLIGPFEVESTLMEHPSVLEAAVIGKPDPVAGEIVKAFVVLKAGQIPSEDLQLDILAHARRRLGIAVAPREFSFIENLPKTRSGKIMRRLLKARELGLPEGDTSTLEMN